MFRPWWEITRLKHHFFQVLQSTDLDRVAGRLGFVIAELSGIERIRYVLARRSSWLSLLDDLQKTGNRKGTRTTASKILLNLGLKGLKNGGPRLSYSTQWPRQYSP